MIDAASGTVKRSVESTSAKEPVVGADGITEAVKHITGKIQTRAVEPVDAPGHPSGTPLPIPGPHEGVIAIELFRGEIVGSVSPVQTAHPGTGMAAHTPNAKSVVFDGAGNFEYQDYVPARPGDKMFKPSGYKGRKNPGNILDEILGELNAGKYADPGLLKRLRLVTPDHATLAVYDNVSGTWVRR